MKLIIRRDQKAHKGLFGGNKGMIFLLECRVVLTRREQQLLEQYKADEYLAAPPKVEGLKTDVACYTPSILVRGVTHECKDVTILLQTEEIIKEACGNFKTLLTVMATFGGEEVIEYSTAGERQEVPQVMPAALSAAPPSLPKREVLQVIPAALSASPPSKNIDQWYYAKEGKKVGPLSPSELKQMVHSGQLSPNDMLWKDGMANWQPVNKFKWA